MNYDKFAKQYKNESVEYVINYNNNSVIKYNIHNDGKTNCKEITVNTDIKSFIYDLLDKGFKKIVTP